MCSDRGAVDGFAQKVVLEYCSGGLLLKAARYRACASRTAATVLNVREQVSQLGFLGFEILFCAVGWRDLNWNAFDNVDTGRFQCIEFLRIVRHQTDAGDSEMTENTGT